MNANCQQRAVVLSLGSNLGDRLANLQLGIDMLARGDLDCMTVSSVYETVPVGGPDQDEYLNAVVVAATALPARDVLRLATAAEAAAGRVRSIRWGPRSLDVDVIICDDELSADPELTLPHPRAHERGFVLMPWLELEPDAVLPGRGPIAGLLAKIGTAGVRRRPDLALTPPERAEAGQPCT
jgi:2-amino-4-hydroxy-6-hydroxymethyldihydropteridine diphosphokinase